VVIWLEYASSLPFIHHFSNIFVEFVMFPSISDIQPRRVSCGDNTYLINIIKWYRSYMLLGFCIIYHVYMMISSFIATNDLSICCAYLINIIKWYRSYKLLGFCIIMGFMKTICCAYLINIIKWYRSYKLLGFCIIMGFMKRCCWGFV